MKKLFISLLFAVSFVIGKSQPTPQQIDACKGVAAGQNSYSVSITCPNFPTSSYQMEKICVTYTITNTGASTLKVNSITAVGITLDGSGLAAGDIVANQPYVMIYDNIGTKWTLQKADVGVAINAGSNISIGGSYPSYTVTNTAPNQTVTVSAGSNISIGGGYPSYTVTNTATSSQWITATSPTTAITYTVGSVGIGTMTPSSIFNVKSAANKEISFANLGTGLGIELERDAGDYTDKIYPDTYNPGDRDNLVFDAASGYRMLIAGNSAPMFDINGRTATSSTFGFNSDASGNDATVKISCPDNNTYGVKIEHTATQTSSTNYALHVIKSGAGSASTNVAGYFSATNGDNNYGIIVPSGGGSVGFGTSTPTATLEVVPAASTVAIKTSGRSEESKGANVAAANDLTLGYDGNVFVITGNTTINAITIAGWQAGSQIVLIFTGTPTVKDNTAGGAGTAKLFLAGSTDFTAANNSLLGLVYDGTQFQETFRKVD